MDTLRVDIAYRPLRIGWVIKEGDFAAFREAVRLSHSIWGGCFNPILIADRELESRQLVELYRLDFLHPIGDGAEVKSFSEKFPHLVRPLIAGRMFLRGTQGTPARSHLLDIHNALTSIRDIPARRAEVVRPAVQYSWNPADPLSDLFLIQLGGYPDPSRIGVDYEKYYHAFLSPTLKPLPGPAPMPAEAMSEFTIARLSRLGMKRHHSIANFWKEAGFFVGSVSDLDDLVCFWNLKAADVSLEFVDPEHIQSFGAVIRRWANLLREEQQRNRQSPWPITVWSRSAEDAREVFPDFKDECALHRVGKTFWDGNTVVPPMMYLDEVSVLGVLGQADTRLRASFALSGKPFSDNHWFSTQKLVASVSFTGGLAGNDHHTLRLPYIPELNLFCSRYMNVDPRTVRLEPDRIGIVVSVSTADSRLYAMPTAELFDQIFQMAGYQTKLSNGGLITRQIIARFGGLFEAAVFRAPGVRQLLKDHGPTSSFTRNSALQTIAGTTRDAPGRKLADVDQLYLPGEVDKEPTTAPSVFSYLVKKGLFRIGRDVQCPNCRLSSWIPIDHLKQMLECELCGAEFDATAQLIDERWAYRRSGVLGSEKNAMGAVPVTLTLHQMYFSLGMSEQAVRYSLSLNLTREGSPSNECEIDFAIMVPRSFPKRAALILGECKDIGPIAPEEFRRDLDTLDRIAAALPSNRFQTFLAVTKLSPFTQDEVACVRQLNSRGEQRVILMSNFELEQNWLLSGLKTRDGRELDTETPEGLVEASAELHMLSPPNPHAEPLQ